MISQRTGAGTLTHLAQRNARRRNSILLSGAVALCLSGCGLLGEPVTSTGPTPSSVPLTTTSTTEPSPSSSPSPRDEDAPELVGPQDLMKRVKTHSQDLPTVTITGRIPLDDSLSARLTAQGSTGGVGELDQQAGVSKSTLRLADGGGRLEMRVVNAEHYLRADEAWFATRKKTTSPLARHAGRWVRIPQENSPINEYRPNQLLKNEFYGSDLTPYDQTTGRVSTEKLRGTWTFRVDLGTAGATGPEHERVIWVEPELNAPHIRQLGYETPRGRTTLVFSRWGSTSEEIAAPANAKELQGSQVGDL